MAKRFFLVSTKATGLKFEVVSLNKEKMRATLKGDTGAQFEVSVEQKVLDELGYRVEVVEMADAAPAAATA